MVEFKVFKTKIDVFSHPNADKLELLKIGNYQCVAEKGLYKSGDTVVFAPEKSLLPKNLAEPFRKYLKGVDKNRVGKMRLRGELSMGVILPLEKVDPDNRLPLEVDIAEQLGITKYEPPIPQHLAGEVEPLKDFLVLKINHDVEQFAIYADQFTEGEPVNIFEKLHGSQVVIVRHDDSSYQISSKGLYKKGLCLKESDNNTYWRAVKNSQIFEVLDDFYPSGTVQAFGEVVPVQPGFNYGCDKNSPEVFLFRLVVDNTELAYAELPQKLFYRLKWCPSIAKDEPFSLRRINKLGKKLGTSCLDNNQIAEGIVISPIVPRRAKDGSSLYLKVIGDRYAKVEDDEAIA